MVTRSLFKDGTILLFVEGLLALKPHLSDTVRESGMALYTGKQENTTTSAAMMTEAVRIRMGAYKMSAEKGKNR